MTVPSQPPATASTHSGTPVQIGSGTIRRRDFLRNGKEFSYVREHGSSAARRRLVFASVAAPDGRTRLGLVVSRRYDTRAVARNRIRRLIREAYRLLRHGIEQPVWLVVIARQHAHDADLQAVQHEMTSYLRQQDLLGERP